MSSLIHDHLYFFAKFAVTWWSKKNRTVPCSAAFIDCNDSNICAGDNQLSAPEFGKINGLTTVIERRLSILMQLDLMQLEIDWMTELLAQFHRLIDNWT